MGPHQRWDPFGPGKPCPAMLGWDRTPPMAGIGSPATRRVPPGWDRSTLRLCWKEIQWSRTPLVMAQDPHGHWDPIDWDKTLCPLR